MTYAKKKNQKILLKAKKYIKSYASLRGVLRLFSYGCYTRNDFQLFGISGRKYDDHLYRIREIWNEKDLNKNITQRYVRQTFNMDAYRTSLNFFIHSFEIKTVQNDFCLYTIKVLQMLNHSIKETTLPSLRIKLELNPAGNGFEKDSSFLRRLLANLTDSGYLMKIDKSYPLHYRLAPDRFANLTAKELKQLFYAVAFACNTTLLSVPGYYLLNTIREYLLFYHREDFSPCNIYQFKSNVFTRMLDDSVINEIITAIKTQQDLLITLQEFSIAPKQKPKQSQLKVKPLKIETEYIYNRQYLIAQSARGLRRIRIDKIEKVKLMKSTLPSNVFAQSKTKVLQVQFSCPPEQQKSLLQRVKRTFPAAVVDILTPNCFIITIKHPDPLSLIPSLRTFHPYNKILLSDEHHLNERMKKDIEESLVNYGIISRDEKQGI